MEKLQTQLRNTAEIRSILREVNISSTWENEDVDVRLIYLPCINGTCDISSLFAVIKKCLMTNFVFSYKSIQKKLNISDTRSDEELFKMAIQRISKKTAHGELGELLLFTLLDVYLEAPKILSKISMKTSRRMYVHGADAIHAQYVNGELRLYLGESKLHKSFKGAATKATQSISDALENYQTEYMLISEHINFPGISSTLEKKLLSALNPFESRKNYANCLYSPCFIGFAEPNCFLNEKEYINTYKKNATNYIVDYFTKLSQKNIHHSKSTLLMLPFPSIKEVVHEFISYMGIAK